jgi:hypothetical protein
LSVESIALIEIHFCVQLVHGDCCVIVRHWTNRCSETGEFDLCDRELDDLWQQPISFTGDGWMNLLKNISWSLRNCCQNWNFRRTYGSHYWYSCILEDLCTLSSLHAHRRLESSKTRNLPAFFFYTMRMKVKHFFTTSLQQMKRGCTIMNLKSNVSVWSTNINITFFTALKVVLALIHRSSLMLLS